MSPPNHKKKRPKRSHNQSEGGASHHNSSEQPTTHHGRQQQQQQQIDRLKRHQEALALSQQLRQLSSQKRLKECLELYRSPTNDELRDAHHGSIVVDCCARCGDVNEAEKVIYAMLQSSHKSQEEELQPYFWLEYQHFSYKRVPIQAWTALLKGYVHSGMLPKADSLFQHLCARQSSIAAAGDGGSNKRKHKTEGADNGLNVRTLNTLLRGCLWTATSLNIDDDKTLSVPGNELVGGVMTAERAWSLCEDINISFDSSSYEYYISVLSQSLQCKAAENCLQKMRREFGIPGRGETLDSVDPTMIESLVVCLVVITRGYALLGKTDDGRRCSEEALQYLDLAVANKGTSVDSSEDTSNTKRHTTGGKKAWKDSKAPSHSRDDGISNNGRREESNKLFRSHRLSELRSEVLILQDLCSQDSPPSSERGKQVHSIAAANASYTARFMLTRLLYFSGGGTTGKDATQSATSSTKANVRVEEDTQQRMHSLWHSFGLKETVQLLLESKGKDDALGSIFHPGSPKRRVLPLTLSSEICTRLESHILGNGSVISSDSGRIDFTQVFKSLNGEVDASSSAPQRSKKLNIELGAGSGDWACLQAKLNPSENYVTVELRADRVAQTFAKCLLHQQQASGHSKKAPLTNLCCVGSECGSFLRARIEPESINTIFVNHPEPPTQTYNVSTGGDSGGKANSTTNISTEEPAHMLNSQTILSAARCLEPQGKGRLVIVTDNQIYARLICHTVVRMLGGEDVNLVGLHPSEVRDLRRIESFGHSSVHLYEGKPSLSIGHCTPQKFEGGTSYFDRLWRTGAGKHADMRKRYIIVLRTCGGDSIGKVKSHGVTPQGKNKSPKPNGEGEGKKTSKKSSEKQQRRNERRLLKKQQLENEKEQK